ncbi:MAG: nucleotidyltransferase domain-containing protein, partial [Chlamydiia bacterium]|nr:nucleotidyltransferase domain-containing protein [Chlamydiia bacterium]
MKFDIKKKESHTKGNYQKADIDIAYEFAKKVYKEFGKFLKAIVLFGSAARRDKKAGDIDILMIVDDVSIGLSEEMVEAYRVIVEKIISNTSNRLHITTLKFTNFWEYVRGGDPVGLNMLRSGMPLIDTGFFAPMQQLLLQGRIRPSNEAVMVYMNRAKQVTHNSRWHLMQATLDLYWAVIDAAHSAIMSYDELPPSPADVAKELDRLFVKNKKLEIKYVKQMKIFYDLSKNIVHGSVKRIEGKDYDSYAKMAYEFVERM